MSTLTTTSDPRRAMIDTSDELRRQADRSEQRFAAVMGPAACEALVQRALSDEFQEGVDDREAFARKLLEQLAAPIVEKVADELGWVPDALAVRHVRSVAPGKYMLCYTFRLRPRGRIGE